MIKKTLGRFIKYVAQSIRELWEIWAFRIVIVNQNNSDKNTDMKGVYIIELQYDLA